VITGGWFIVVLPTLGRKHGRNMLGTSFSLMGIQTNLGIGRNMQETRGDSKPQHFEYLGGIVPK
jgi:hypothetical protein